ncbi:TetR/AcrR family transcriptional regulator [Xenorhabdus bovienii]|uniref:TetR/AcrR family transcriptional regulator n=1 Tax=Xenorhabdus bovienii TaxID=40576 RepID=UPI0023B20FB7|nr:TetR/AcrR family transcriptional regulator [Xenorhabdus bovienii]MDE9453056.1 TetR/AcrR family transcriptional regulator [Xenorhabdus bovienii]
MTRRTRSEMIEETRSKLIDAALHAFAQRGYAETSMDDFTASVGLTRGALYHHFGDKKGLLLSVVEKLDTGMDQRLKAASDKETSLWKGFVSRCHLYLEMAIEPEIQRIVLRDAPSVLGAVYTQASKRQCLTSLTATLSALMEAGTIKKGDSATLARLINGALVDAALWIADGDSPNERLVNAIQNIDLLLYGLVKDH